MKEKGGYKSDARVLLRKGKAMHKKTTLGTYPKVVLTLFLVAVLVAAQLSGALPALVAYAQDAKNATADQAVGASGEGDAAQTLGEGGEEASGNTLDNTTDPSGSGGDTTDGEASDSSTSAEAGAASSGFSDTTDFAPLAAEGEEITTLADGLIETQEELEAAIAAATGAGATNVVTLTQDIELTRQLAIPANWSGVLSGGGFSLTLAPGYTGRHINYTVANSGYLRLENISFKGGGTGGGVALSGGNVAAIVEVASSSFINCNAAGGNGGGLYLGTVTARISSSTFSGNTAGTGGGLYLAYTYYGTIISALEGCVFNGNTSTSAGGALYTAASNLYSISNTVFTGNSSPTGGAIYAQSGSDITINGGRFANNSATGNTGGGAIFTTGHEGLSPTYLTITGVTFESNSATVGGGALYNNHATAKFTIADCNFIGNTAGGDGGAIHESFMEITNTNFTGNEAGASGGAIQSKSQGMAPAPLRGTAHLSIQGGSFAENTCVEYGGAIATNMFASWGTRIDGTAFSNNYAGWGYVYTDFSNPIDELGQPDAMGYVLSASVNNYYARQTLGATAYAQSYTNIASISAASEGYFTSNNIINNYDLGDSSKFLIRFEKGADAEWAGSLAGSTRLVIGTQPYYSRTLAGIFQFFAGFVERDGYVLVGFINDDLLISGYGEDFYTEVDGYRVLNTDTSTPNGFVRGYLYLKPVWGEAVDVTYHWNSTTSAVDPSNSYYKNQSGVTALAPAALDETWIDTEEYSFIGWATTEEAVEGETLYSPANPLSALTEDVNLYARFAPNTHTVTFESNGGSAIADQFVAVGATAAEPSAPSYPGYTFEGWCSDSALTAPWNFSTVVTADMTLYAKWSEVSPPPPTYYNVTYAPGSYGTFAPQTTSVAAGSTTPAAPSITGQAGWRFTGWSPVPSATVTASVTYTAQWAQIVQPANTYTVTFVDWDGTVLKTEQVANGGSATPPADPTRTGYRFDNWDGTYTNVTADSTVTARYLIQPSSGTNAGSSGADTSSGESKTWSVIDDLINDPSIPTFNIGGIDMPLHAGSYSHLVWALVNLVLMVIGVVLALITLIFIASRKSKNGTAFARRIGLVGLLIAGVMAVVGIAVFFLTENMSLPMVFADSWTLLSALILIVEIIGMILAFRALRSKEEAKAEHYQVGDFV